MADASERTLVRRSRVDAATAAAIMAAAAAAAAPAAATAAGYHSSNAAADDWCTGYCIGQVCQLTPKAEFCCLATHHEGNGHDGGYGGYAKAQQQAASGGDASGSDAKARAYDYDNDSSWVCWRGY
jgi:hypothetical protein